MDSEELQQIAIAAGVISFAFLIAQVGLRGLATVPFTQLAVLFAMILSTVGLGFILHELAHKFVAQRFGAHAAFRAWPQGLVMALAFSIFGFVFAAPGAVYIYAPYLTRRQNGLISVAGPLTNVLLSLGFFVLLIFSAGASATVSTAEASFFALPLLFQMAYIGSSVNLFLAFFNMLPFFPLDGAKVLAWNKWVWAAVTIPLVFSLFLIFF